MRPPPPLWGSPPVRPVLEPDIVHLWRARLDTPLLPTDFMHILSADEIARADRLKAPSKARDFIVSRIRLRQILGRYLELPPASITFSYGPHGKPLLSSAPRLHFNLAHSGVWMLLAIGDKPIGVDLERIDADVDWSPLARRYFNASEQHRLNRISASRQRRMFYRLWTRKEAYLKGLGGGFSETVVQDPSVSGWHAGSLFLRPGYVAALAVQGEGGVIARCWDWE